MELLQLYFLGSALIVALVAVADTRNNRKMRIKNKI